MQLKVLKLKHQAPNTLRPLKAPARNGISKGVAQGIRSRTFAESGGGGERTANGERGTGSNDYLIALFTDPRHGRYCGRYAPGA